MIRPFAFLVVLLALWGGTLQAEPRVKIGFLVKMPEESWFQTEWKFAEQAGRDLGFDVLKIGASDGEKVLSAIDNLAAQGAKGFVICAPDPRLGPAIQTKAAAKGLKFMAVDDELVGTDGMPMGSVPYLGIGAREIGLAVAGVLWNELLARKWDVATTGAIAITFNELTTARERIRGTRTLLEAAGLPGRAVFEVPEKTTDVEGGFNAATVAVAKNPWVKHWLVFGMNDESVVGGVQAVKGRGFSARDVVGVGINGMALAVSQMRNKAETGFFASVLLDARAHGYQTAAYLYRWITLGEVPPRRTITKGTVITRENFVEVLQSHGLGDLLP